MAEKVELAQASLNGQQNDPRKVRKSPEFQPGVISRERSFVRTSNQQVSLNPPILISKSNYICVFGFRISTNAEVWLSTCLAIKLDR